MYDFLTSTLHVIAQVLMIPVIIALLALICYVIYQIGTVIAEVRSERRKFDPAVSELLNKIEDATPDQLVDVIDNSGLLRRQREALIEVIENRRLAEEPLFALAKKNVAAEKAHYDSKLTITDMIARLAPMIGLMGTLIPLGPGILALSTGDTLTLSSALLVAFDTTIAGLLSAVVCMVISRFRRKWYGGYMQSLEAVMTAVVDRIEVSRDGGESK